MKLITTITKSGINIIDDIATKVARTGSAQSDIKFIGHTIDAVNDTLTKSPNAKMFTIFSKKIAEVKSSDDLTILAQEFKNLDLDDVMRQELISQYVSKYESFYNQLYRGQAFEPKILFKQIFNKELSDDAAQTLCDKYKSILAEPDFNTFLEKLYVQAKKDFDLDYIDIKLDLEPQRGKSIGLNGSSSTFLDFIRIRFFEDNPLNRRKAYEVIMHELNHMKQNEISIAVNAQEYINAIAKRMGYNPQDISQKIGGNKIYSIMQKYGEIPKDALLYKRGIEYIESNKNYFSPNNFTREAFLAYKKQPTEAESYTVQKHAGELFYLLTGNSI